jgi:oligogalacturonide lyase
MAGTTVSRYGTLTLLDLKTGEMRKLDEASIVSVGDAQFSPIDPHLILFLRSMYDCVCTIRSDGTGLTNIYCSECGIGRDVIDYLHDAFFSPDGKTIFYYQDQWTRAFLRYYHINIPYQRIGVGIVTQEPLGYLAGLPSMDWSTRLSISSDQTLFCGAGPDTSLFAKRRWLYLLRPQGKGILPLKGEKLVKLSELGKRKLLEMCEFTPDSKWVVFDSRMFGPAHIFAVEVAKAK